MEYSSMLSVAIHKKIEQVPLSATSFSLVCFIHLLQCALKEFSAPILVMLYGFFEPLSWSACAWLICSAAAAPVATSFSRSSVANGASAKQARLFSAYRPVDSYVLAVTRVTTSGDISIQYPSNYGVKKIWKKKVSAEFHSGFFIALK